MIDWYLRRSYVSRTQADALKRWQADAYLSGLIQNCIGSYQQSVMGRIDDIADCRIAAQARRNNAITAITHKWRYAVALIDAVAVDGKSAGRWMMETIGGSPAGALDWLNKLSDALAKHYGYVR